MCSRFAILISALSLAVSCTVFEDRVPCPCFVTLDYSEVDKGQLMDEGLETIEWHVEYPDSTGGQHGVNSLGAMEEKQYLELVKTNARLSVLCLSKSVYRPYSGIYIEEGEDCPEIYAWTDKVDASAGDICDTVRFHKLFARMEIVFADISQPGSIYKLYGGVCGYDENFMPVPGFFLVDLDPGHDGRCEILLPRQVDDSLKLLQYEGGKLVHDYSLGEYLSRCGYDWNAPDLDDLSVEIGCGGSEVKFKINQWKKTQTFIIVF